MEIALAISFLLLLALTFLATVDMAFGQLSDVGLRRLVAEAEEHPSARNTPFLKEILENRARFSFHPLGGDSDSAGHFHRAGHLYFSAMVFHQRLGLVHFAGVGLVLAGIFRQFIPRLLSLRNPEGKLPRLLPVRAAFLPGARFCRRTLASLVRSLA